MKDLKLQGLAALVALSVATAAHIGERSPSKPPIKQNVAAGYIPLRRVAVDPNSEAARLRRRRRSIVAPRQGAEQQPDPGFGIDNLKNQNDLYYVIDLKVGDQTVTVSVDTGSSDTWFIGSPLECVNPFFGPRRPNYNCGFGKPFTGTFSHGMIPDETFSIAYGDGTFVTGNFGLEDITLGSSTTTSSSSSSSTPLTARMQKVALVDYSYWFGDGVASGLMGLAYPLMTALSSGRDAYDPIFWTLWKNNLTAPFFSIALSREGDSVRGGGGASQGSKSSESFLALGGLPPTAVDEATWARTPIRNMQVLEEYGVTTPTYGLYVIFADAYVYGHPAAGEGKEELVSGPVSAAVDAGLTRSTTQFPVIIDVGATLTRLPKDLAFTIYNLFNPPARLVRSTGLFYAPCNATAVPAFGVQIGNQVFYMSPRDLLRQNAREEEVNEETGLMETLCRIGITDSNFGPWILGVTFVTNVVAVFDVGQNEMRFAARRD